MQSAPAVTYPVGRCFFRTTLYLAPVLLGGLACAAWASQAVVSGGLRAVVLLAWLGLAVWTARAWLCPAQGQLAWDGRIWHWQSRDGTSQGRVRTLLDWQDGLLLEFVPEHGRSVWLWPERRTAPDFWSSLRRAVVSSPGGLESAGPVERA